jgi:hypothetical protein
MLDPPRKQGGPEGPPRLAAAKQQTAKSIADPYGIRRRAQKRVRRLDRHRRVCRELEQLAPLVRYYGPRRPRPVPLDQFLAEGWWAA